MAYHETTTQKIKKLLKNPKDNISKIIPFVKSKIFLHYRDLCELLGFKKYSKPYPGHTQLLSHINYKNGFFVQCGGNDGYFQDPSYYLEKFRGWKGIIVEPLPISRLCKRNRKNSKVIQNACVSFAYSEKTVSFIDCNAMSFVKGSIENGSEWIKLGEDAQNMKHQEISVPARTIQSIIDENTKSFGYKEIDLLIADVEGYELQILQGLDFEKNPPKYILLEIQTTERFKEIEKKLTPFRYQLEANVIDKDYLFVKK